MFCVTMCVCACVCVLNIWFGVFIAIKSFLILWSPDQRGVRKVFFPLKQFTSSTVKCCPHCAIKTGAIPGNVFFIIPSPDNPVLFFLYIPHLHIQIVCCMFCIYICTQICPNYMLFICTVIAQLEREQIRQNKNSNKLLKTANDTCMSALNECKDIFIAHNFWREQLHTLEKHSIFFLTCQSTQFEK